MQKQFHNLTPLPIMKQILFIPVYVYIVQYKYEKEKHIILENTFAIINLYQYFRFLHRDSEMKRFRNKEGEEGGKSHSNLQYY